MKKKCNRLIGVGLGTIITTSSILGVNSFADIKDITGPLPVITETTITKEDKTTTETTKVVTTERTTEATTESKTTERTTEIATQTPVEPITREVQTTEATTKELSTETTTAEVKSETTTAPTVETSTDPLTEITTVTVSESSTETTTKVPEKKATIREYNVTIKLDEAMSLEKYLMAGQISKQFVWHTSDSKIATADDSGSIYGVRAGSTTVTAYSETYIYIFHVSVNSSDISAERNLTIYNGNDCDLSRYVQHDSRDYNWGCSNTSRAKVDKYGTFVTRASGYVEVTATYSYNNNSSDIKKYTFKITIKDKPSGGKGTVTRYFDKKMTILVPTGENVNLSSLLAKNPSNYTWTTSNSNIATVNRSTGKILGIKSGNTTVYAEGGNSYAFTVRVSDDYSSIIKELKVGETLDVSKYLSKDISKYSISAYDSKVMGYSKGIITANSNGTSYIICDGNRESVQIIVKVSGTVNNNTSKNTTSKNATTNNTNKTNTTSKSNTTNTINKTEEKKETTPVVSSTSATFNDISERAWAVPAIEKMASKNFIVGKEKGRFAPDEKCTRADFTIVLTKMLGVDNETPDSSAYSDVDSEAYFSKYVGVAKKLNITAGESNNSFFPKNNITREEVMAMVYKALAYKGVSMNTDTSILNSYVDASQIAPEYKEAVAGLLSIKAVNGTSDNTIDPKASITRAQMAVLMNNFYGKIE